MDCVCCQDLALLVAFSNKNRRLQVSEKQVMVVMLLIRVQMDLINGISGTVFTQTFVYLVSSLKESLIADGLHKAKVCTLLFPLDLKTADQVRSGNINDSNKSKRPCQQDSIIFH